MPVLGGFTKVRGTSAAVTSAPGGARAGRMRSPLGGVGASQWAQDMGALYTLLALELLALYGLRHYFRRHHGG